MHKTKYQKLEEQLTYSAQNLWEEYSIDEKNKAYNFAGGYKQFLDKSKTENEAVSQITAELKKNGYKPFDKINASSLGANRKFYYVHKNKYVSAFHFGQKPLTEGVNLIVSHIDAPRLDLKPRPLFEDDGLGYLKTHYYGGIKKYQWINTPLSLHGRVIKGDGGAVDITIGESDDEPVFMIADLEAHLSRKGQEQKKLSEAFSGEDLVVLFGSVPVHDKKIKEKVKLNMLEILNKKYGITEEDFISSELCLVPALRSRDGGIDRSVIIGYGHDDRSCAYASLKALCSLNNPQKTAVCLFVDKEETGSDGTASAKSPILNNLITQIVKLEGSADTNYSLREVLKNSNGISADVTGALNPMFKDVHDITNAARLNCGPVLVKYTGSGGKYGTNDSEVEYFGKLRRVFNGHKIKWQTGLHGKIDAGGGGTVAKYISQTGIEIADLGPAVLATHAPHEIVSKADLYETMKAYSAFFKHM